VLWEERGESGQKQERNARRRYNARLSIHKRAVVAKKKRRVVSGFKPKHDIAAIVLNRWGHARLIEPPGFHYGVDGKASTLERVRQGYGRISIGHSELNGAQHWGSALEYGRKAGERATSA
jgi:spermidine dehydrogenase